MKTTPGPVSADVSARFSLSRRGHGLALLARGRSAALLMTLLGTSLAGVARGQVVTEFPIPTASSVPRYIVAGPEGNLWFIELIANQIGRVTAAGVVTEFSIPTAHSSPRGIAAGPDGNIWFTESDANQIGRITATGVITEFPIPTAYGGPIGIAAGPDGNLWFTESGGNKIGRITTAGAVIEYPVPTAGSQPWAIAAGVDGNLWFVEYTGSKIGRISTVGVVTEFSLPTATPGLESIAAGPDGNLWFTSESGLANLVGRITTGGAVTEFPIPTANSQAWGIGAGPDGNLWFAEIVANQIGRITTAGVVTEFAIPTPGSNPRGISAGADGNVWFTEYEANKIGRITTAPTTPHLMAVDAHLVFGGRSNANGMLEPGETVQVAPSWENTLTDPQTFTGTASNPTGPPGATFTINDSSANYGTIAAGATGDCSGTPGDCYLMTVSGARPAAHWDVAFTENLSSNSISKVHTLHVGESFPDVPASDPFYSFIENLFHNGVTAGNLDGGFHPGDPITRAQMAVFLLKGKFGPSHIPPPATGTVFPDVHVGDFAADWIEELGGFRITAGCDDAGDYCPNDPVTRAQMAVFLLKSEHGSAYAPPPCTGLFADVECSPTPAFAVDFIEQLSNEDITAGCAPAVPGGLPSYCPDQPNKRGEMAVFLVKTFDLTLYGSSPAPQTHTVGRLCLPASCTGHTGSRCVILGGTTHVRAGDTIDWVWSSRTHSTTSGHPNAPDGKWDSGAQPGPYTFSHTFAEAGAYPYFCSPGHVEWFKACWTCACAPVTRHETGVVIVTPRGR